MQLTVHVTTALAAPVAAKLNVWADWNGDGRWGDSFLCGAKGAPEWVVQNQAVSLSGYGNTAFTTTAFLSYRPDAGKAFWLRVSLSDSSAPAADGRGPAAGWQDGETEDYLIAGGAVTPTPTSVPRYGTIRGLVQSTALEPLPATEVLVCQQGGACRTVWSDSRGIYESFNLPAGLYVVSASRVDYRPTRTQATVGGPVTTVNLFLAYSPQPPPPPAPGAIRATVLEHTLRVPIPNARIDVVQAASSPGAIATHASVDASGRVTLPNLPPGIYNVIATARGYSPNSPPTDWLRRVTVTSGGTAEVTLTLNSNRDIVLDPVPGSDIDLSVAHVLVTQAVQRWDNSLPLAAGVTTSVRVFANLGGRTQPLPGRVNALLSGDCLAGGLYSQGGSIDLPVVTDWNAIWQRNGALIREDGGFLFYLPPSCTTAGTHSFTVEILPTRTVRERTYANNRYTFTARFQPTRPLVARLIPITFRQSDWCWIGSRTDAAPRSTYDRLMDGFRVMYPARISWEVGSGMDFCKSSPRTDGGFAAVPGWWSIVAQIAVANADLAGSSYGGPVDRPLRIAYGVVPAAECAGDGRTCGASGLSLGFFTHWAVAGLSDNPWTAAHETGHSRGYYHASNSHGEEDGGACEFWPYEHGGLGEWGLEIRYGNPTTHSPLYPDPRWARDPHVENHHDNELMSYGWRRWVSDITWMRLFQRLQGPQSVDVDYFRWVDAAFISECAPYRSPFTAPAANVVEGDALAINPAEELRLSVAAPAEVTEAQLWIAGVVTGTTTATIDVVRPLTGAVLPASSPVKDGYALELRDAQGKALAQRGFRPTPGEDGKVAPFMLNLPYTASARHAVVLHLAGGKPQVLADFPFSARPPTVRILSPNGGETFDKELTLTWEGTDPDGDALTYDVTYSADGGETWRGVNALLTETSLKIDLTALPGSTTAMLRVLASDGFNTATDETDGPFVAPTKSPEPLIREPRDGARFQPGEIITLEGMVIDPEEPAPWTGVAFAWTSDRDGAIAHGSLTNTTVLSSGRHTITLKVTDTDGNTATRSVRIYVGKSLYLPAVMRR